MTGIVTCAGLDVHARSTHAAAIDIETGEVVRARFGPGIEEPVAWLRGLRAPLRACYEAGGRLGSGSIGLRRQLASTCR
jgi:hypothetical protein